MEWALRPGVRFHNGEAFNADTLLFNLDRMFKKNLDKWNIKDVPTAGFDKTYPFVSRWEKVNDLTVRIHTTEPAPTLGTSSAASLWCPRTTRSRTASTA